MQVRSANWSTMPRFLHQNLRICRVAGQPQHARIQFPGTRHASLPAPSEIAAVIAPDRLKALTYCTLSLYWMAADEPGTKDPHLPALGWTALWSWMTAAGCWAGQGDSTFL
jgi:hypothetical protein